jgi:hypothetical protein
MAVGISFTGGVFDKNRGAAGDAVDDAAVLFTFRSEGDARADSDVEFGSGAFSRSYEFMAMFSVSEESVSNILETLGSAATVGPEKHFCQMDQFMLHDPLHCFESICAIDSSDSNGTTEVTKGLEEECRR